DSVALAMPSMSTYHRLVASVRDPLVTVHISVLWVFEDGTVTLDGWGASADDARYYGRGGGALNGTPSRRSNRSSTSVEDMISEDHPAPGLGEAREPLDLEPRRAFFRVPSDWMLMNDAERLEWAEQAVGPLIDPDT